MVIRELPLSIPRGLEYPKEQLVLCFCLSAATPALRALPNLPHPSQALGLGGWEVNGWRLISKSECAKNDWRESDWSSGSRRVVDDSVER